MHFRVFRKVKVINGEHFWGLVKFQIFLGCLKFLIFIGGGGAERQMLDPSLRITKK